VSAGGLLALIRPLNLAALWLAVEAGARLSGGQAGSPSSLAPVLTAAFGYARNDAVDWAADLGNRPSRPIPSGRVAPWVAGVAGWLCLALGAGITALCAATALHAALLALAAALLYFYSPWLKESGPAGPATVALLGALAVAWGAWMGPDPGRALAAAALAGCVTFARECAKDLEDEPGDRSAGKRTWAVRSGTGVARAALRTSAAVGLALVAAPWLRRDVGSVYLLPAGAVSAPALLWVAARPPRDPAGARRASLALKAALFAGVAGLWLGAAGG
jgi:4-hydroxybenzoate polyprenyltransferase